MIEKTTINRGYPKPDVNNSLQDDVANIESAIDMIDTDIHQLQQEGPFVPRGGIIMWSGAVDAIPEGWALCNGSDSTPDLRDRFIVGAGGTYPVGNTGGESNVTLTTAQMPSHNHTATQAAHNHTNGAYDRLLRVTGTLTSSTHDSTSTEPDLLNSGIIQSATPAITVASAGGGGSHENKPPYYALCFIMKL